MYVLLVLLRAKSFIQKVLATWVAIAKNKLSIVYGGGSKGLMGVVADAALEGGASVTGVITEKLHDVEMGHN